MNHSKTRWIFFTFILHLLILLIYFTRFTSLTTVTLKMCQKTCVSLSERGDKGMWFSLWLTEAGRFWSTLSLFLWLCSWNSSKQVTGAPIRLQSSLTAEIWHSMRDSAVTWEQDHVVMEELSQKNELSHSLTCSFKKQDWDTIHYSV